MSLFSIIFAIAALLFLVIFVKAVGGGGSRGGRVRTRFSADLKILDPRFEGCRPEAEYCIFKEGTPEKIEIEVERLPLEEGEDLEFYINGKLLSRVKVDRKSEAEFEHWSDGDVPFPHIKAGDTVDIIYQGGPIVTGVFELR